MDWVFFFNTSVFVVLLVLLIIVLTFPLGNYLGKKYSMKPPDEFWRGWSRLVKNIKSQPRWWIFLDLSLLVIIGTIVYLKYVSATDANSSDHQVQPPYLLQERPALDTTPIDHPGILKENFSDCTKSPAAAAGDNSSALTSTNRDERTVKSADGLREQPTIKGTSPDRSRNLKRKELLVVDAGSNTVTVNNPATSMSENIDPAKRRVRDADALPEQPTSNNNPATSTSENTGPTELGVGFADALFQHPIISNTPSPNQSRSFKQMGLLLLGQFLLLLAGYGDYQDKTSQITPHQTVKILREFQLLTLLIILVLLTTLQALMPIMLVVGILLTLILVSLHILKSADVTPINSTVTATTT